MSSPPNDDTGGRQPAQKVTISPISSEILAVRIRTVNTEMKEEDIPKPSNTFKPLPSSLFPPNAGHSKSSTKKDRQRTSPSSSQTTRKERKLGSVNSKLDFAGHSKPTMTDRQKISSSSSSQTARKGEGKESSMDTRPGSPPCLKHAALNISRKATDIPAEKINLCNGCSKSMLSYIFLVQDFLDSLAKEIGGEGTPHCLQCARQEVRDSIASLGDDSTLKKAQLSKGENSSRSHSEYGQSRKNSKSKDDSNNRSSNKRTPRTRNYQESKWNEGIYGDDDSSEVHQTEQTNFAYKVSPPNDAQQTKGVNISSDDRHVHADKPSSGTQIPYQEQSVSNPQNFSQQIVSHPQQTDAFSQNPNQPHTYDQNYNTLETVADRYGDDETQDKVAQHPSVSQSHAGSSSKIFQSNQQNEESAAKSVFLAPMQRVQPNYDKPVDPENGNSNDPNNNFPTEHSPSISRDGVDGIISTLSNAEREIYDTARNGAGWESLTEPQEKLGLSSSHVSSEAFVTSCRNNAEAIGCLVVGTSLLLCRTSRTLCVLVSDGVSTAFRGALSAVFQVVQNVRSLDSLGSTKLALIEQPELGITFDKLNVWRLTQFSKCVYLNPDTLVIQNCDELFCHAELSAVPDIGWPDCFNSGVFVFAPSANTFWQLMEFSEKQGSYDGGDQGLLNSYFNSWSCDINKKLSFIYNLMANVSYTYTPAFKQFGRNVKIVQFHGSFKPWHVKFFTNSGQISPSSPVHPTYVQFVHIWLNIFRISVLRLMSQEIQKYSALQETICAVEILRFFPLPSESEADFFLTPPSVRLRLAEKKLSRSTSLPISEAQRRKSAEFVRYVDPEDESIPEKESSSQQEEPPMEVPEASKSEVCESDEQSEDKPEESTLETDEVFKEKVVTRKKKVIDENAMPGAEVGDYQGMKAWEQGRIDYEGNDSSDNVIKRLQFLMSRPK